ncbi:hypothetical protein D0Z07_6013 [Hyphodiscus hymeniophilus]|uniref:Apc15p protein-domain-containing protein n=1 Tax=Hyphodiscus hymeniophilus TaxID=353542 RepID=A0A9P6VHE8_9HELO|nr:hypothetical protein D0Z07_6013 [Hyphodiscus hymeniophilus]
MFSLPSLAPQDSHTLWYIATNSHPTQFIETTNDHLSANLSQAQAANTSSHRRHALHRTPLARLRMDEEYMERRKQNVQNYGNSWIRPPGIPKTLFQQREEKREMEEHQEALRREALAQELAEAEAEGVEDLLNGGVEEEVEEVRDLDDEVPEAETTGLDADDEENDGDEDNESEDVPRGVLASRIPDDVFREALVRGEQMRTAGFGEDGGSAVNEEDASQMLQEEDLVHDRRGEDQDVDMDMDADLDADIPEADSAEGYEHTDTEEELTSSEEEESSEEGQGILHQRAAASSMIRSDGTQNSMDLSNIVSRGSQIGSSPQPRTGFERRRSRQ